MSMACREDLDDFNTQNKEMKAAMKTLTDLKADRPDNLHTTQLAHIAFIVLSSCSQQQKLALKEEGLVPITAYPTSRG